MEVFEWKSEYCDTLQSMYRESTSLDEEFLVLLKAADEVLDYRLASSRYQTHQVVMEQGGNHRFENLHDYLPVIDKFLNASLHQKIQS